MICFSKELIFKCCFLTGIECEKKRGGLLVERDFSMFLSKKIPSAHVTSRLIQSFSPGLVRLATGPSVVQSNKQPRLKEERVGNPGMPLFFVLRKGLLDTFHRFVSERPLKVSECTDFVFQACSVAQCLRVVTARRPKILDFASRTRQTDPRGIIIALVYRLQQFIRLQGCPMF